MTGPALGYPAPPHHSPDRDLMPDTRCAATCNLGAFSKPTLGLDIQTGLC